MSTTLIITLLAAAFGALAVIIYLSHRLDEYKLNVEILQRRNRTLEERFEKEDAQAPQYAANDATDELRERTGVEILEKFARTHQIMLTPVYDDDDKKKNFKYYSFTYQGGLFYCYAGTLSDEMVLRYYNFCSLPHSPQAEWRILEICNGVTDHCKYARLTYRVEENEIQLALFYEMLGISQSGLDYLFSYHFDIARDIRLTVMKIPEELEQTASADEQDTDDGIAPTDTNTAAIRAAREALAEDETIVPEDNEQTAADAEDATWTYNARQTIRK